MRNFGTVPVKSYIGAPGMQAANICKNGAMQIVPFTVQWATYLLQNNVTQMGVNLDLTSIGQVKDFPPIRSVYIDNEGNNVPVWVRFPDTGHTVACQPNSAGWFPVFTNTNRAVLYAVGFTPADFLSATAVYVCDTFIPPYVDNELAQSVSLMKASPTIQRGQNIYNSLYAAPALGDQTAQISVQMNAGYTASLFGGVKTSGFYYLTGVALMGVNVTGPANAVASAWITSTGVSGLLYDFRVGMPTSFGNTPNQTFFNQTGLQLKLDATEDWQFRNGVGSSLASGGILELFVNWTYQP